MAQKFDSVVAGALDVALTKAMQNKNAELVPLHFFYGLLKNPSSLAHKTFATALKEVEGLIANLPQLTGKVDEPRPSPEFNQWITYASSHAIENGHDEVREGDVLRFLPQFLPQLKLDYSKLSSTENAEENKMPAFLINLNERAAAGKLDPVIGRTKEIRAVMEILGRRNKNNPVLVGPAGVGKTAIVEGLADAIVKGQVPDVLRGKVVYALDLGQLMAGTKYRGEFEERMQALLKFVAGQNGEAILFIDEIHQLVGAGRTDGAMDAANLLKPALARGELHCIGATTPDEFQKYILGDAALERRFRQVVVNEPEVEDAIEILMGIRDKLEIHHGIQIADEAIYQAVMLSNQYITDKFLPDKAIDLVDEAAAAMKLAAEAMPAKLAELAADIRAKKIYAQMEKDNPKIKEEIDQLQKEFDAGKKEWDQEVAARKEVSVLKNDLERLRFELDQAQREQNYELASQLKYAKIPEIEKKLAAYPPHTWVLKEKDIAQVIARQIGVPVEKILKTKQNQILGLEAYLKTRVLGQDGPLHEIAETLITSYVGLAAPQRPLGSFLLQGPSGVGKTETAKAVCDYLFDNEKNLVRIDLSEYSEKHAVAKLIGAPPGYVGHEEGGALTEAVRRRPYAAILFDEIEKAHPDFADILLQILDDGRLTDSKGRTVSFKNTVIFMTTNSTDIKRDFKAEVLGRIDAILDYHSLDQSIMRSLVGLELKHLQERLQGRCQLTLDDAAIEQLAIQGYDAHYGARPLKTVFLRLVARPLAHALADGTLAKTVKGKWDASAGKVIFS